MPLEKSRISEQTSSNAILAAVSSSSSFSISDFILQISSTSAPKCFKKDFLAVVSAHTCKTQAIEFSLDQLNLGIERCFFWHDD